MSDLELEFQRGMMRVYETARQRGYTPTYFKQMLDTYGGVEAAKRLLAAETIQSGLQKLWELQLLGHSMEALVTQEHFHPLFTEAEMAEARRRLEELGYFKR